MTTDRSSTGQGTMPAAPPEPQRPAQEIDVRLLAEKVYRLLLADLRLEQARSGQSGQGRNRP